MALARKSRVLNLIGSPSVDQQSRLNVDEALKDGDRIVYDYTRKSDWITPDPDNNIEGDFGFEFAREAAEKWAAFRLMEEKSDQLNKAPQYREEAQLALDTLRKIGYPIKDGDNPSFYSTVSKYKSIALNDSVERHLTRNFFGGEYD